MASITTGSESGSETTCYVVMKNADFTVYKEIEEKKCDAQMSIWSAIPKEKRGKRPTETRITLINDNITQQQAEAVAKKMNAEAAAARGSKKGTKKTGAEGDEEASDPPPGDDSAGKKS